MATHGFEDVSIFQVGLDTKTTKTLDREGLSTIGLVSLETEASLGSKRLMGPAVMMSILRVLSDYQLSPRAESETLLSKALSLYPTAEAMPAHVVLSALNKVQSHGFGFRGKSVRDLLNMGPETLTLTLLDRNGQRSSTATQQIKEHSGYLGRKAAEEDTRNFNAFQRRVELVISELGFRFNSR